MSTRRAFITQTAAAGVFAAAGNQVSQVVAQETGSANRETAALKTGRIPQTDLVVSRIAYGTAFMTDWDRTQLSRDWLAEASRLINTAYDNGITLFDLSDHYGFGKAERTFGEVLKQSSGLRNRIILQSKCGISFGPDAKSGDPLHFASSREHIVSAVEGSLRRLGTEHLDILLIHWPDALVEPEEVAHAFDELKRSGKVRYFGVSNHSASQIELLKGSVMQPLVVNQIRLSLENPYLISGGLEFMWSVPRDLPRYSDSVVDYCRRHEMQVQAYAPVRGQLLRPPTDAVPEAKDAARVIADLANKKSTTPYSIALAWLMHHPAKVAPIFGSSKTAHIVDNCTADRIALTNDEWYSLLIAVLKIPPQKRV